MPAVWSSSHILFIFLLFLLLYLVSCLLWDPKPFWGLWWEPIINCYPVSGLTKGETLQDSLCCIFYSILLLLSTHPSLKDKQVPHWKHWVILLVWWQHDSDIFAALDHDLWAMNLNEKPNVPSHAPSAQLLRTAVASSWWNLALWVACPPSIQAASPSPKPLLRLARLQTMANLQFPKQQEPDQPQLRPGIPLWSRALIKASWSPFWRLLPIPPLHRWKLAHHINVSSTVDVTHGDVLLIIWREKMF